MKFAVIDWIAVVVPALLVIAISLRTRKYVKGVADFMAGGRVAGRYLVAVSDGMAAMGLITVVGQFEFIYQSGFAIGHWSNLAVPVWLFINLTGYIVYRFRETRAMTMAQFFEIRYSKSFRIFTGGLAFISGVINYGIFPAVSARFFIYYCGLPEFLLVSGVSVPTYALLMALFLGAALLVVLVGGHLTNMVSDCIQGIFGYAMYLVIAGAILYIFSWHQMSVSLLDRAPGESLLNPFDAYKLQDFNLGYVVISIIGSVYAYMAWQGNQGFNCSAATPHEAKMGRILGTWRAGALYVMLSLMAAAAYTFMHHPDFAQGAAIAQDELARIENPAIRTQMTVPIALSTFFPIGIKGVFAAVMLFLMLSTDITYLHSWGSILVQDVILPARKQPFETRQHLRSLRLSIVGVAIFAFLFSLLFRQNDYIFMFFSITGAIYLGGAGSVIVGGLYWKRGTTAGAWASMITGALLGAGGLVLQQIWPSVAGRLAQVWPESSFLASHMDKFPINGQWMWFYAFVSAIAAYVLVSLVTCREPFNMDRMLHRGSYAREDAARTDAGRGQRKRKGLIHSYLGIDEDFTRGDRWLSYLVFGWTMVLFIIWLVVTVLNLIPAFKWSNEAWASYFWIMGILFPLIVGVITSIWFTWGGVRDLRVLFRRLSVARLNVLDDGRVVNHRNVDDLAGQPALFERNASNKES